MNLADVAMLFVAVLGGAAALLVVVSRNVVHAAVYLVVALLSVAGAFLVLGSEFLAWAQVLVYVGAVIILILFGLMLTRAPIGPMAQENELGRALPIAVSGGLFAILVTLIWTSFGSDTIEVVAPTRAVDLGAFIYVDWAFPFMVLGYLLTVALIGAVVVARREEGEGPLPEDDPTAGLDAQWEPTYSDVTGSPGARPDAIPASEPVAGREVRT